jgi:CheY-like chemotaxis protein
LSAERSERVVLLVEDNAGDAGLVQEMLEAVDGDRYRFAVVHANRMSEAIDRLGHHDVDIVLLDLGLPDALGEDALTAIQRHSGRTPIVVLTGHEDEALDMRCIALGAQDYRSTTDIRPVPLRRSINYAINRSNEQEIRDLRETLDRYREMSSRVAADPSHRTNGTHPPLRSRAPQAFETWVEAYAVLLRHHFDRLVMQADKPRDDMNRIVAELGNEGAGPRDLVDIHVSALGRVSEEGNSVRARTFAVEGRLVALEMMGLLVDYYRVRKGPGIR